MAKSIQPKVDKRKSSGDSVKKAADAKKAATETLEQAWERIFKMKNSDADREKLRAVQRYMAEGKLGREAESADKKFSKAEAIRLYAVIAAMEREGKLTALVEGTPKNYRLITSYLELDAVVERCKEEPMIAVDTETTGLDVYVDVIVGISITMPSFDDHVYIPVKPTEDERAFKSIETVLKALSPIIGAPTIGKVLHNATFDMAMFERHGFKMEGLAWDTMTAMHLLNENEKNKAGGGAGSYQLKDLATRYLGEPSDTFAELFGKDAKFAEVPLDVALVYAAKDTHLTWKLYEFQRYHLSKMPTVLQYLEEVEIPLIEAIYDMERTGFVIDVEFAKTYGEEMRQEILEKEISLMSQLDAPPPNPNEVEVGDIVYFHHPNHGDLLSEVLAVRNGRVKIKSATKEQFPTEQGITQVSLKDVTIEKKREHKPLNLNSSQQLKPALEAVIFQELPNLDAKKTLKPLAKEYPIIEELLEYRGLTKLYSTYISVLPELVHPVTGRFHVRMNPNGAKTGRFSSGGTGANMQNQPYKARSLFIAPEGKVIIGADFSAQEVRCVAALSGEPTLIKAFEEDKDAYATMASEFFGKPYKDVYKDANGDDTPERKMMKTAYLASLYGTGPNTLAKQLKTTPDEARKFLKDFFNRYKYIRDWIDETQKFMIRNGYVWIGDKERKRRLPEAKKKTRGYDPVVEGAKRQGPNARVQGWSAIQTKKTLVALHRWVKGKEGWDLWLTVHDEILLQAPIDVTREEIDEFERIMVGTLQFGKVGNKTDIEIMTRWGEGYKVDQWFDNKEAV